MVKVISIGNTQFIRVDRTYPCPICGKTDWCMVYADQSRAVCMRIKDATLPSFGSEGGTIFPLSESAKKDLGKIETLKSEKMAKPNVLHKVYSLVISVLGLSEKHLAELTSASRGLSRETIALRGYASSDDAALSKQVVRCDRDERGHYIIKTIWEDLFVRNGLPKDAWKGVPGFSWTENQNQPVFRTTSGILIPCRNEFGQIIRMQVRVDDDKISTWAETNSNDFRVKVEKQSDGSFNYTVNTLPEYEVVAKGNTKSKKVTFKNRLSFKIKTSPKYIYVSSANETKGTSATSEVHCAFSDEVLKQMQIDKNGVGHVNLLHKVNNVIATEGLLKGDIAAFLTPTSRLAKLGEVAFVCMPGVSVWKKVADKVSAYNFKTVHLAFDQDFETNTSVYERMSDMILYLVREKNTTVKAMLWQGQKGIDDFLLSDNAGQSVSGIRMKSFANN